MGRNNPALKFSAMMLASLMTAVFAGSYLDQRFNTTPFITLGFIVYAIIGSFMILLRSLKHDKKNAK